jgi:hypothetical protein
MTFCPGARFRVKRGNLQVAVLPQGVGERLPGAGRYRERHAVAVSRVPYQHYAVRAGRFDALAAFRP